MTKSSAMSRLRRQFDLPKAAIFVSLLLALFTNEARAEGPGARIEITAKNGRFFNEQQVDQYLRKAGIKNFVKLIVIADRIYHVIGLSRGGNQNYVENGFMFRVDVGEGRWFEEWEEDAIVVGRIAAETMSDAQTPPGMRHYYNLGSVVRLGPKQTPHRVIGLLDLELAGYSGKIFGHLWRIQTAYNRRGQISSVLITVDTNCVETKRKYLSKLIGPQALIVTYLRKTRPRVDTQSSPKGDDCSEGDG